MLLTMTVREKAERKKRAQHQENCLWKSLTSFGATGNDDAWWGKQPNQPIIVNCSPGKADKKINGTWIDKEKALCCVSPQSWNLLEETQRNVVQTIFRFRHEQSKRGKGKAFEGKLHSFSLFGWFFSSPKLSHPNSVMNNGNWKKNLINCFNYLPYLDRFLSFPLELLRELKKG